MTRAGIIHYRLSEAYDFSKKYPIFVLLVYLPVPHAQAMSTENNFMDDALTTLHLGHIKSNALLYVNHHAEFVFRRHQLPEVRHYARLFRDYIHEVYQETPLYKRLTERRHPAQFVNLFRARYDPKAESPQLKMGRYIAEIKF